MKPGNFLRILAVSLALSAYSCWLLSRRPREGAVPPAESVPAAGIPLLRLAQAEAHWRQGSALFLDVRPAADYAYGHIPGALLCPEAELERRFAELRPRLERARVIVVYCGSRDCGKSFWTALRLRQAGLKQTTIYPAGWNEWYLHGLPVRRTADR